MVARPGTEALRVLLQLQRAQEAGDPFAFRFEPQDYILPTEGGSSPSAHFPWTAELLADLEAIRQPGRDPELLRRLGETLRRFLLQAGWATVERDIAQALRSSTQVVLSLRSSAAELYALPWELLLLANGKPIGEEDRLLLRFEWPDSDSAVEQPSPRPEGGRILVAWSAAGGGVPAEEHIAAIASACRESRQPFDPATSVLAQASLSGIAERLEAAQRAGQPVSVLHLLCHGSPLGRGYGLRLDGAGGQVVVDAAQVRKQLEPFAGTLRLVVLSACDSGHAGPPGSQLGSVAQQLHRGGIGAVIASRYPLSVAGSIQLAETLYERLLPGLASLEEAFLAVRKRLARQETSLPREQQRLDWASLQLYARQSDGDDTRPWVFRPYRGLLPFGPEHRRFFFGRDAEVDEILSDLQALAAANRPRFLVVAGSSGTGKSSLVLAGAVPKLLAADPKRPILRLRPGSDPLLSLSRALGEEPWQKNPLLVVDQFEEIFTQTQEAGVRQAFVRRLWALASAATPQIAVIVTLRVDFIGRCGELSLNDEGLRLDQIAYAEDHRVFIAQLRREQLRSAIVEPAQAVGLQFEGGLVERMLDDVGGEPGALPLLQDALDVLWQHRSGNTLTQRAYLALGGVVGALQRRADELLASLSEPEQASAQRLLVSLVAIADDTALDTRRAVPLAELRQTLDPAAAAGLESVLRRFVAERLLVQGGEGEAATVEVAHEALIRKWPRLRTWLSENRAGLLQKRRIEDAAQQWAKQTCEESLLYRGTQLAQAREWRKTWAAQLGERERRFLDASEARKQREDEEAAAQRQRERKQARKTQIAAAVLGLLFLVALFASGVAYLNTISARDSEDRAKRSAARFRATLLLSAALNERGDPTTAALLLRESSQPTLPLWQQAALSALHGEIAERVLRRHVADVSSVAFSPDGRLIATASRDQCVLLWNADHGDEPTWTLGHPASVLSVAFSPDSQKLVTGSADQQARIFKISAGRVVGGAPLAVLSGHRGELHAVAFSPDGKKILTGSADQTARIWNAEGSGEPAVLAGHQGVVTSVAFSPDGKKILTGSLDHTARLWNSDGTGEALVLRGHEAGVTAVAFSPSGQQVLTGSLDHTARLWRTDGTAPPLVLRGHDAYVLAVAFSPSGHRVLTGGSDKTLRSWSAEGGSPQLVFRGHAAYVMSVAYSPDGSRLASASGDQTVRIWHTEDANREVFVHRSPSPVRAVALSSDETQVAAGHEDHLVRIFRLGSPKPPLVLAGHSAPVNAVAYSPDGKTLASASADQTVRLWNGDGSGAPRLLPGHQAAVTALAYSPDGSRLVSASADQTLRVYRSDGSGPPLVLSGHTSQVNAVAFSPDGKRIASGSQDRTVRLWNADGSGPEQIYRGHSDSVNAVAFSPDGSCVLSGSSDRTLRVVCAHDDQPRVLRGHESYVSTVSISRRDADIVSGGADGSLRIWPAGSVDTPQVLSGHLANVTAIAISRDSETLLSGSADGTIRRWPRHSNHLEKALWNATSDCLPVERRVELLSDSTVEAHADQLRCRSEVARRHAPPSPR